MFESDDFDEILSQFEIPGTQNRNETHSNSGIVHGKISGSKNFEVLLQHNIDNHINFNCVSNTLPKEVSNKSVNKKHKLITNHFGHQKKRKFPGPAGLLTGSLSNCKEDEASHVELLSQDIDYSTSQEKAQMFESSTWKNLLDFVREANLGPIDTVRSIKQQALSGCVHKKKAHIIIALVEAIDRSATDPLVNLCDGSGSIKCTLHREAWSSFSPYISSEYCGLVLWKPTILTTGGTFKKHYLNITLSNIYAIMYSSAILATEELPLPEGYSKIDNEEFTIIKITGKPLEKDFNETLGFDISNVTEDILDDLDDSHFDDDIFS